MASNPQKSFFDIAPLQGGTWVERLARVGYLAKGAVYGAVGFLAFAAAVSTGGRATGSRGALETVLQQPFGRVMVGLLAFGLASYAGWKLVQAVVDPEGVADDTGGTIKRIGYFLSGGIHTILAIFAGRLLLSGSSQESSGAMGSTQERTAVLMEQPYGRWLVALVGLGIVGWAIYELTKAYKVNLSDRLDLSPLDARSRRWAIRAGRFGIGARGAVFTIAGVFALVAAVNADPQNAKGLADSLKWLEGQPSGPYLLAIAGLGLLAYGIYMALQSRYRRIA